MNKILILYAHQRHEASNINKPMVEETKNIDGVTFVDLYAEYPDSKINVEKEQQRLFEHDIIIFQFPLQWYSTPAILKEWQDRVLHADFAYNKNRLLLKNKIFFCALTAGGPEDAFNTKGYNRYTIREMLYPIEQTMVLCKIIYLPPYAIFGARFAKDEQRLEPHIKGWITLLEMLKEKRLDIDKAMTQPILNSMISD